MKSIRLLGCMLLIIMAACQSNSDVDLKIDIKEPQTHYVSLQDAQGDLEGLLNDLYGKEGTRTGDSRKSIQNAYTIKIGDNRNPTRSEQTDSLMIHVFNFENEGGFALMSADDRMPSLLALANSGHYTSALETDNPGFSLFMENLVNTYSSFPYEPINPVIPMDTIPGGFRNVEVGEWENIVYKPGGYCNVTWGQEDPYYNFCPIINGQHAPTGCVATAAAQLISIYKFPSSYNGHTYNWSAMTSQPKASYCTTAAKDQIAHLMADLGLKSNLNMNYNLGGSGAFIGDVSRTLKHLGYSKTGDLASYSINKIESEIKNGYSVLVRGATAPNADGHCWLIHGLLERTRATREYYNHKLINTTYETEWYPLCNWGWNGDDDGYYLSAVFDPSEGPSFPTSTRSSNLNCDMKILTNIRK